MIASQLLISAMLCSFASLTLSALLPTWSCLVRLRVFSPWVFPAATQVANKRNGIDVDKFDYLLRDSKMCGVTVPLDPQRIMMYSRLDKDREQVGAFGGSCATTGLCIIACLQQSCMRFWDGAGPTVLLLWWLGG